MRENKTYKFAVFSSEADSTVNLANLDWHENEYVMFTTEYEPEDAAHAYLEEYADKDMLHTRFYYVKNLDKNEVYKITIKPEKSVVWFTDKVTKLE
jgi:hypothetical protein